MRIFNRIRRLLLAENRFVDYLKYAAGEIVLVVIGILIALQINNWNQQRQDDRALAEYLVKIRSHTQQDLRTLDTVTMYRSQLSALCQRARGHILDKTEDDNLLVMMSSGAAFADYYFKPNTGGYEALRNSAYFGKINNTPLDSFLTRYHALIRDIAENERSYNDYVVRQEAQLSTEFDRSLILASAFLPPDSLALYQTTTAEYFADFAAYTAAAPYRNVIGLAAFQFDSMVFQYGQLREVGEAVIEEIDGWVGV